MKSGVRACGLSVCVAIAATAASAVSAAPSGPAVVPASAAAPRPASGLAVIPPLVGGDEPIVVTQHQIHTARGTLSYETRAGRLPIRNDENGEVRGHIFFVAYVVKGKGKEPRPLTFAWNGGPTAAAVLVHTELLGPRRLEGTTFVDNAESLLFTSDLVFYDPIETGFSRPEKPEYDKEFLTTLGDFAETAEFVRAYRARFAAERQPLFLLGESYGTWRVNGTTEILTKRGTKVAGVMLISGGVPGSQMPFEFIDAFYVPDRTAAAFYHKRLSEDLMRDRAATMRAVEEWVANTYFPALQKIGDLDDAQRDQIARDLARYTGVSPTQIDRKKLVMSNREFLTGFFGGDKSKTLDTFDMRIVGFEQEHPGRAQAILDYLRGELGYRTDIAYTGLEDGYMPISGPERQSTGDRWVYDHTQVTPELLARMNGGGGPPASLPWLQNSMRIDHELRAFVGAGQYDSLNMCAGNLRMVGKLEPDLSSRFTTHCYEGGHMMYRDQPTRRQLAMDLERFIRAGKH